MRAFDMLASVLFLEENPVNYTVLCDSNKYIIQNVMYIYISIIKIYIKHCRDLVATCLFNPRGNMGLSGRN